MDFSEEAFRGACLRGDLAAIRDFMVRDPERAGTTQHPCFYEYSAHIHWTLTALWHHPEMIAAALGDQSAVANFYEQATCLRFQFLHAIVMHSNELGLRALIDGGYLNTDDVCTLAAYALRTVAVALPMALFLTDNISRPMCDVLPLAVRTDCEHRVDKLVLRNTELGASMQEQARHLSPLMARFISPPMFEVLRLRLGAFCDTDAVLDDVISLGNGVLLAHLAAKGVELNCNRWKRVSSTAPTAALRFMQCGYAFWRVPETNVATLDLILDYLGDVRVLGLSGAQTFPRELRTIIVQLLAIARRTGTRALCLRPLLESVVVAFTRHTHECPMTQSTMLCYRCGLKPQPCRICYTCSYMICDVCS